MDHCLKPIVIEFARSKSVYYGKACDLVKKLGGKVAADGSGHVELGEGHGKPLKDIAALVALVRPWKHTVVRSGGEKLTGWHLSILLRNLLECHKGWEGSVNQKRWCQKTPKYCKQMEIAFGCRLLCDLVGWGDESWVECGERDAAGVMHLDKKRLAECLMMEAERKALILCPKFDHCRVEEYVDTVLPKVIVGEGKKDAPAIELNAIH